jgi:hypothetical protein
VIFVKQEVTLFRCINFQIYIGGSSPELGNLNNEEAVPLSKAGHHYWQCTSIIRREEFPIKYKYMLKSKSGEVTPEIGTERVLSFFSNTKEPASMIIASDGGFRVCSELSGNLWTSYSSFLLKHLFTLSNRNSPPRVPASLQHC